MNKYMAAFILAGFFSPVFAVDTHIKKDCPHPHPEVPGGVKSFRSDNVKPHILREHTTCGIDGCTELTSQFNKNTREFTAHVKEAHPDFSKQGVNKGEKLECEECGHVAHDTDMATHLESTGHLSFFRSSQ